MKVVGTLDFKCIIWSVEHGSSAMINCPNGKIIMLDAGRSGGFSPSYHLKQHYNINQVDKLIISHPHRDHIEDIPNVINNCKPRILLRNREIPQKLIYPSEEYNTDLVFQNYRYLDETYVHDIAEVDKDTPIGNWGNVEVVHYRNKPEWLGAPSLNNLSLLTIIRYLDLEIVFPGDLEPIGWDVLLNKTSLGENVGKMGTRILIASHHGRKSGIRKNDGTVYTGFLEIMKPQLTIISDKWGNETTDPEAYRYYSSGLDVFNTSTNEFETGKKVLTTKTNNYVHISHVYNKPLVFCG